MGRAKQNAGSNISNLILPKSWYVMGKTNYLKIIIHNHTPQQ